ncbi:cystatin-like protein [Leguminivora glycinivorella]|uniref:cystatin-like protein n=1 Tax=Leguminivora glycinivorella TaxID=1035111 RepID=UPI00200CE04D|nr:cystatin-like protein [Leguminivora glycinivorella]XP_047994452.1 cystatin-like protein [Leguminivora glycinivorella]XP_047994453.1 cystatin-like protein [Leguminivora glycinivorella]XP_047994454.1 cystatin-like protein [Leguminivora glycinivorella]
MSNQPLCGGISEADPNDPKYIQLAHESFAKYCETNPGGPIDVKEIKVIGASHQVVAGSMTRITFAVEPANGEIFTCYAKIWEQPWLNKKEIEVTCDLPDNW